jgi:hypothetical protein
VTLRRTPFDPKQACAEVCSQSSYPDVAEWADYFLYARAGDGEAVTAFGPRDGRSC